MTLQWLHICLVTHVVAQLQVLKHPTNKSQSVPAYLQGLKFQLADPRHTDFPTRRTLSISIKVKAFNLRRSVSRLKGRKDRNSYIDDVVQDHSLIGRSVYWLQALEQSASSCMMQRCASTIHLILKMLYLGFEMSFIVVVHTSIAASRYVSTLTIGCAETSRNRSHA